MGSSELTYGWAAFLGFLQGITEFLPVSSSGHLALAEHLGSDTGPEDIAFDILLHLATVLVVCAAFWKDFVRYWQEQRLVIAYLVVASVPTAIAGAFFMDEFKALRESPIAVCAALLVTAAALVVADRTEGRNQPAVAMGWFGALCVGLCQALAITPGISRSGLTLTGGLVNGLRRTDALAFSFLLMVPAVLGAAGLQVVKHTDEVKNILTGPALTGAAVAAVSGYFALKVLMGMVRGRRLKWFALYCAVISISGLVWFGLLKH